MVEVDPAVLILGGTAIIGATVVAVACSGRNTQPPAAKASPIKKKKPTKSVSAKAPPKRETEAPSKEELLPFKQTPAVKREVPPADEPQPPKEPVDTPHVAHEVPAPKPTPAPAAVPAVTVPEVKNVAVEEELKASKKPKETPEQKAARLERQKLAKANKAAEEVVRESTPEPAIAVSVEQSSFFSEEQESTIEGWEVVGKIKQKKAKSDETEKKVEKKVVEEVSAAIDSVRESVVVENKKVGAIIGPKGSTLHKIQDATGAELTLPKDRETALIAITITGPAEGVKKGES